MGFFKKSKAKVRSRAVVVGLDGVPYSLLGDLASRDIIPDMTSIFAEGYFGQMSVSIPEISSVSWSSFMTGSNPSKHNIFDFLSRDPKTYLPDLSSARIGKPKKILSLGKYNIPFSKPEIKYFTKIVKSQSNKNILLILSK